MPHSYLVIGGGGFLGRHVVEQIRARQDGSTIAVFDIASPKEPDADITYHVGDLRKYDDVLQAMKGITAVIHTASPPHVNSSNPPRDLYFSINVDGTKNVIKACQEAGVPILVVTSSGSVISTGEPMVNVDEHTPYPPLAIDVYTESKIGNNSSLMDFTYVGNIAYAHVLAAEKLALSTKSPVGGQAFNLTNGTPVPFWDFASKVWYEYGKDMPKSKKIILSYNASMVIAYISETIYDIKALFWDKATLKEGMTRSRIKQAMSSRYFNIDKARTLLGYEPIVGLEEGIKIGVENYKINNPAT
ncbi:hypothetical protein [Absidia glauca]|uniref:3-beta hydroxysteroid dehydrogenase/isomerase domain-containing protein n=1 Tax=Absidia glauca TaxID=4829 RepID=A0A168ST14_ABSGL|nr:hypothetical protein [Absidia glauca]